MNKQEILEFMKACGSCFLATVEGNQPHVRGMMPYRIDEDGVILHTGKMKDIQKQLANKAKVELCFFDPQKRTQVRVTGTMELLEDLALKKEIVTKRDFLKPWIEKVGYDPLTVFRIKDCVATAWTFETNFSPKTYVNLGK
jgi:uncharacterized pyridoxamine 5'-phosphate oxidase family protein